MTDSNKKAEKIISLIHKQNTMVEDVLVELFGQIWEDMKKHGQPVQNNKNIWDIVDALHGDIGKEIWGIVIKYAEKHHRYDLATKIHNQNLMKQKEFYVRLKKEKNKKCDNNTKAWKTIMCANDHIQDSKKQNNFFGLFD